MEEEEPLRDQLGNLKRLFLDIFVLFLRDIDRKRVGKRAKKHYCMYLESVL